MVRVVHDLLRPVRTKAERLTTDMRDPKRIDRIVEQIRELWKKYPDMRLGQMMAFIKSLNEGPMDGFYVEDHEWEVLLRQAR